MGFFDFTKVNVSFYELVTFAKLTERNFSLTENLCNKQFINANNNIFCIFWQKKLQKMCNFSQIKDYFYYIDFPYFCRTRLKGIIEKAVQYHSGAWQKIIFVVLADKSLHVENVFECVVRLPETPYAVRRTMLYTPSKNLFYKYMSVVMSTVM